MIQSMTGYGQGSAEGCGIRVSVELKSVNHRYVDLRLRLPSVLQDREREIRHAVLARVGRGRVEMAISVESESEQARDMMVNRPAVEGIIGAARELRDRFQLQGSLDLQTVLAFPGVLQEKPKSVELAEEEFGVVLLAVQEALESFAADRSREGEALRNDISEHLGAMTAHVANIRARSEAVPDLARKKLTARVAKLAGEVEIDRERIAQEIAILADRCDVTEELVRLESHLEQAVEILHNPGKDTVGKRLDFLLQEINRETNTINSKSSDLEVSREALGLKSEAEKVREQVQNLE